MSASRAMRVDIDLAAICCTLVVGVIAIWSNPKRLINILFLLLSLLTVVWLLARRYAMVGEDVVLWIRATNFFGAYVPFVFAILKYAVTVSPGPVLWKSRYFYGWASICCGASAITLSEWFIPSESTPESPQWGGGYYAYSILVGASLLFLFLSTVFEIRRSVGVKRLELQLLLLGGSGSAALILALMVMKRWLGENALIGSYNLQPLIVMGFYSLVVYSMTNHRILDAAQLALMVAQKLFVLLSSVLAFVLSQLMLVKIVDDWIATISSIFIVIWVSRVADMSVKSRIHVDVRLANAKRVIYEVARQNEGVDSLLAKFSATLTEWAETKNVYIHAAPSLYL